MKETIYQMLDDIEDDEALKVIFEIVQKFFLKVKGVTDQDES